MSGLIARRGSLTDRTVVAAQGILSGKRRGPGAYLAFAGPAVVASIAYMDPGNFAPNVQAGAKYGYSLLWVVLLANRRKCAVTISPSRWFGRCGW
jgi:manganese transport protein